jgi:transposase
MIVIGSDPHKRSDTAAAVGAGTGELRSSETVQATSAGHERMLAWARALDPERVWAIEDCRHVSGKLERFLLARGERVVRVPPKLMAGRRRASRERGKSDPIDALAVARAALEEGLETLPAARLAGPAREVKLLLDHREDLVAERARIQNRLRWLLHDRWPELEPPKGCLDRLCWLDRLSGRLARASQDADVRVMRAQVRRLKQLVREAAALERELLLLVRGQQPRLLALPGVGALTAAKLIAEIAGIERFRSPAKLARLVRHRADPGLERQHHSRPARPRRQPAADRRLPPDRGHPAALPPAGQGLRRSSSQRGQDQARGASLPQASSRPHRLQHDAEPERQRRRHGGGLDIGATSGPRDENMPSAVTSVITGEGRNRQC